MERDLTKKQRLYQIAPNKLLDIYTNS